MPSPPARALVVAALLALFARTTTAAPARPTSPGAIEREAQVFLQHFTDLARPVSQAAAQASWQAAMDATPTNLAARSGAERAAAAMRGAPGVIERARRLLSQERRLRPATARLLKRVLLEAAASPGTLPDLVNERGEEEARQAALLERPAPPELDRLLRTSLDSERRAEAWNTAQEAGRALKPGLQRLVRQRNQLARAMGYSSHFALEAAHHDMSVKELMALLDGTVAALGPLHGQLSCWARRTLAARFNQPVPALLPAHWLSSRWGQTLSGLTPPEDPPPSPFATRSPQAILKIADDFFRSLGFPPLPASFWQRSDLLPVPAGTDRRKGARAATFDLGGAGEARDVRVVMSVEPTAAWFHTAHHELAHVHQHLSRGADAQLDPPLPLRGASRALWEAIGELSALASEQPPYLKRLGLLLPEAGNPLDRLLSTALESVVFLRFAAGTVAHFEHDLYEGDLPVADWQGRWWHYVARYQGMEPPAPRPGDLCDACTKPQLSLQPARYHDYALAVIIKHQLHDHICRKLLQQDVRACDYAARPEAGAFLRDLLAKAPHQDWRQLLREKTGEPPGARALVEYFAPLGPELARRNQGGCP